jgi:hypothetical protein
MTPSYQQCWPGEQAFRAGAASQDDHDFMVDGRRVLVAIHT